ncbi:MAG TPA: Crp/Fnr family transcriptional regulator [Gammaproteobacteria bacterium]|nr:Crp/Fnr family transcriptional regulator [Gammaproteobacteria bacterium]
MAIDVSFREAWVGLADCRHCASRELSLFAGLCDDELEHTRCPVHQYRFKHGSVIYRAAEKGHDIFTLRTGLLKLERFLPDGNQRIVRLVRPNDIFGIETLVNPVYEHDAVVLRDADICKIPVETVQRLGQVNPKLHQEIMNRWQSALSEADNWLTELLSGTAKQRVARLLLKLIDHQGKCSLLSREDMGAMLSVTTETASRIVAEFKRQGLLSEVGHNLYTCDEDGLLEITDA